MKKTLIASLIVAAIAVVVALVANKTKKDILDQDNDDDDDDYDYDEFFGNDEGDIDVDIADEINEETETLTNAD